MGTAVGRIPVESRQVVGWFVSFWCRASLLRELDEAVETVGISRSRAIGEAIRLWIDLHRPPARKQTP